MANPTPPSTMPALALPPPPYTPSSPYPASSLTYHPSHPTPTSPNHYTVCVLTTSLTRGELTWTETLSPNRKTAAIPGHDGVGTIVSLPTSTTTHKFNIGDQVFALLSFSRDGAAAGYALASEEELAVKPSIPGVEEAVAIPLSGLSAWQAFFEHGGLEAPIVSTPPPPSVGEAKKKRILITGASGGVGVMAVQIAKATPCVSYVAGTCSSRNTSFVKGLGADDVIDYTAHASLAEGVGSKGSGPFDMILDTVGSSTLEECCTPALIKDGGKVVSVAMPLSDEKKRQLRIEERDVSCTFFIVKPDGEQLGRIGQMVEDGRLRGVVEGVWELEKGAEAMGVVEEGRCRGKVVLRVG